MVGGDGEIGRWFYSRLEVIYRIINIYYITGFYIIPILLAIYAEKKVVGVIPFQKKNVTNNKGNRAYFMGDVFLTNKIIYELI